MLPGVWSQHLHEVGVLKTGGHKLLSGHDTVRVHVHFLEDVGCSLLCCVCEASSLRIKFV